VSQPTRRFHIPSAFRRSPFRLDVAATQELIRNGALLVDVRREDDPSAELTGSVRIAPDEVPGRLDEFPRDLPIVLACT
jgi:rhodanese-related sulfurtransferase